MTTNNFSVDEKELHKLTFGGDIVKIHKESYVLSSLMRMEEGRAVGDCVDEIVSDLGISNTKPTSIEMIEEIQLTSGKSATFESEKRFIIVLLFSEVEEPCDIYIKQQGEDEKEPTKTIKAKQKQLFSFVSNQSSLSYTLTLQGSEKTATVFSYMIHLQKRVRSCRTDSPKSDDSKQSFPFSNFPSAMVYGLFQVMRQIIHGFKSTGKTGISAFSNNRNEISDSLSVGGDSPDYRRVESIEFAINLVNAIWKIPVMSLRLHILDVKEQPSPEKIHFVTTYKFRKESEHPIFERRHAFFGFEWRDNETGEIGEPGFLDGRYFGIWICVGKLTVAMIRDCMDLPGFGLEHELFGFVISQIVRLLRRSEKLSKRECSGLFVLLVESTQSLPNQMEFLERELVEFGVEDINFLGFMAEDFQRIIDLLGLLDTLKLLQLIVTHHVNAACLFASLCAIKEANETENRIIEETLRNLLPIIVSSLKSISTDNILKTMESDFVSEFVAWHKQHPDTMKATNEISSLLFPLCSEYSKENECNYVYDVSSDYECPKNKKCKECKKGVTALLKNAEKPSFIVGEETVDHIHEQFQQDNNGGILEINKALKKVITITQKPYTKKGQIRITFQKKPLTSQGLFIPIQELESIVSSIILESETATGKRCTPPTSKDADDATLQPPKKLQKL